MHTRKENAGKGKKEERKWEGKKRKVSLRVYGLLEYTEWPKAGKQLRSSLRRVIKAPSGEQYDNHRCRFTLQTKLHPAPFA